MKLDIYQIEYITFRASTKQILNLKENIKTGDDDLGLKNVTFAKFAICGDCNYVYMYIY